MNRFPGRFLVLEGIDGAGTTSQAQLLHQSFTKALLPVFMTAEPSRGPIGSFIRVFLKEQEPAPPPISMALLFAADRHAHVIGEIIPLLQQGIHVICDRYLLSSLAYQQAAKVDRDLIVMANQNVYLPDLTIFLSVSSEVALARRKKRNQAQELYEEEEFQKKIVTLYQQEAQLWPKADSPLEVVDGTQSVEQVYQNIVILIRKYLGIVLS